MQGADIVLAARHPDLVSRLVLVDANLDPIPRRPVSGGSSGIAAYSEQEFLTGGWEEVRDRVGPHWWATMRLAGREALHRSAVHLVRGSIPSMRELLLGLKIPRTYLLPERDGPLPGAEALAKAGVAVVATPDCGHNIMLDNPEAFARATATALADQDQEGHPTVKAEVDEGYRGLANEFPDQVSAPPKKPKDDAPLGEKYASREHRRRQSSQRICVEHANAELKQWRPLQRYTGRREHYTEIHRAIAGLVIAPPAGLPSEDGPDWMGTAMLVELPGRDDRAGVDEEGTLQPSRAVRTNRDS